MPAQPPAEPYPAKRRRARILLVGALLLGATLAAAYCLIVGPYLEVRSAIDGWQHDVLLQTVRRSVGAGEAAEIVRRMGGPAEAARKLDWYVRLPENLAPRKYRAIQIMGGFCCNEATPFLIRGLSTGSEEVREEAAGALGLTGDRRAVGPLIAALRDARLEVRANAAWSLGELGDREAVKPLMTAVPPLWCRAYKAIGRDEAELVPLGVLVKTLEALAKVRDPRAATMLDEIPMEVLACAVSWSTNDNDWKVVKAALDRIRAGGDADVQGMPIVVQ